MRTARLAATDTTHHEVLRRVQKTILFTAAALVLAALIVHHGGLGIVIALLAVLALKLTAQLTTSPAASTTPSHSQTKYRFADGGSFRTEEAEKRSRVAQSPIVIDGGTKH